MKYLGSSVNIFFKKAFKCSSCFHFNHFELNSFCVTSKRLLFKEAFLVVPVETSHEEPFCARVCKCDHCGYACGAPSGRKHTNGFQMTRSVTAQRAALQH